MLTRKRWAVALSTSTAIVVALVSTELYLRRHVPLSPGAGTIHEDALLGWDSLPSITALDNAGRDRVVYFIGDSFTQDRNWPAIAQREAARQGDVFDAYALGVSGFGTTQEWLKIEREFDRYRPQVVVLQFFAWNDFRDDWPYPAIAYSPTTFRRPYLVPAGDGYALLPAVQASAPIRWMMNTELWRQLFFRATLRVNDFASRAVDRLADWRVPLSVHYTEPSTWQPFYRPDGDRSYVREAFGSTVEAFRRLNAFLTARHAQLVVIGLDNPFTVDEDVARQWIPPGVAFDPDLPLRRLGARLDDLGIRFVNARPALLDLHRRTGRKVYNPPPGELSGHLEPDGEAAFGAAAARALADLQP